MPENDKEEQQIIVKALIEAFKSGDLSAAVYKVIKEAVKEAFKEWMDGMFAAFGRYALSRIAVLSFVALVALALYSQGWSRK